MTTPAVRGVRAVNSTGGVSSRTVSPPAGTIAGDLMYAFVGGGSHPSLTGSSPYYWETVKDYSGQEAQGGLYRRVADGTSVDNLGLSWDGSDPHDVVVISFVGNPRDVVVDMGREGTAGSTFSGSTLTAGTPVSVDDLEIYFWWTRNASSLPTFSRGSVVASNNLGSCRMSTATATITDPTVDHTTTYPSGSGHVYFAIKVADPATIAPGQEPWNPIALTPGTSTTPVDRLLYDHQTYEGEPTLANGRTVWYKWTPSQVGEAVIDTTPSLPALADAAMAMYYGIDTPTAYSDLIPLGSSDDVNYPSDPTAQLTFQATAGRHYYFQVAGYVGAIDSYAVHLEFTPNPGVPVTISEVVFNAPNEIEVVVDDPIKTLLIVSLETTQIDSAPNALSASVLDADGPEDIVFKIARKGHPPGTEVFRIEPDPDGSLDYVSIPVPDLRDGTGHFFQPGTFTLRALQGTSAAGEADFEVLNPPLPMPEAIGADAAPVAVPGSVQPNGVIRWVFQDRMPGGLGSWVLPMNPQEAGSPPFSRSLTARTTTANEAQGGQFHITEDAYTPVDWTFKGVLPNEEMREKMEAFYGLNRRWYLHDHRGRAWKVVFKDLRITPRLSTIWDGERTEQFHNYEAVVSVTEREWVDLYA